MRLGEPDVHRHQSRLGPEAHQGEEEGDAGPGRRERRTSHRIEGELPAPALQDAEAEEDADRPDVGDEEVEEAGSADLGMRCWVVTRKYELSAMVSQATMNA